MEAAEQINQQPKIRLKWPALDKRAGSTLTFHSSLHPKVSGMISMNGIAAVAQEIAVNAGIIQARSPVQPVDMLRGNAQGGPSQRALEAVPPEPAKPMPRGSLLDLRV
jgi:hypothetical protein